MDLKEIQNLIKFVSNSGVAEVKLEMDDVKITIRTVLESTTPEPTYVQQLPAQAPVQQIVATPAAAAPAGRRARPLRAVSGPVARASETGCARSPRLPAGCRADSR